MRISVILGTRPEAIKLCPVILALQRDAAFEVGVCVTAQHREMLDRTLAVFGVLPDVDLDLMRSNQSLSDLTSRVITGMKEYLRAFEPDLVIVQGDTTTAFAAALAAYYEKISVAHVEAGLRTGDKLSPYPEEINRILLSHLADLHFAPTQTARQNLLREGIPEDTIVITGNTVIDALLFAVQETRARAPKVPGVPESLLHQASSTRIVLITGHRRESFGAGFESICHAILCLAEKFPEDAFVYPVHLNPNVREPVYRILSGKPNVHLIEPLDYLPFVRLLDRSFLVLTDSGGVQEEAPALGKPVLVMRTNTERPEAIAAGTARLVGTEMATIVRETSHLLTNPTTYRSMASAINPYGDGKAAGRIVTACLGAVGRKGDGVPCP